MRSVRPLGALVVALAAVTGCGGGDEGEAGARGPAATTGTTTVAQPVDITRAGSVAQLADCAYWKTATREQRFDTIADIRDQHTPQQSTTAASPLSDERAYEIFDRTCEANPAGALRLYKLYVKVQGFAPLSE